MGFKLRLASFQLGLAAFKFRLVSLQLGLAGFKFRLTGLPLGPERVQFRLPSLKIDLFGVALACCSSSERRRASIGRTAGRSFAVGRAVPLRRAGKFAWFRPLPGRWPRCSGIARFQFRLLKSRPFNRVSGDQRRTTVRLGPRRIRQWTAPILPARKRSVQLGPDPIVHLGDWRRTIWPLRIEPRTRRTRKPGADDSTDDDDSLQTIVRSRHGLRCPESYRQGKVRVTC